MNCNDCGEFFKSLTKHKDTNTTCKKYKNILFTCRLCNYFCKSYNKIILHTSICEGTLYLDSPIEEHIKKIDELTNKLKASEKIMDKYNKTIKDYERTLNIEKVYTNILGNILNKNLKINISEIREDLSDGIHIHNIKEDDIPFIFHTNDKDDTMIQVNMCDKNDSNKGILKPKKDRFRQIDCVKLIDEVKEDEIQNKVSIVDDSIKETIILNFDNINLHECKENITKIFDSIKEGKLYQKDLNLIKQIRSKMLGLLNIKEYEDLIYEHIGILNKIFEDKKYDKIKRNKIISDSFSSLELRLVKFGRYVEKMLDIDDIERLKVSMEVCTIFPKQYVPFKRGFKTFFNYNLVLFTLKKCIECNMVNRYGFNNIIYINMPNSKDTDPYSFYYLEKIENDKRCWKLDCRLEDISEELSNTVLPYCITLYKKIYMDMFGDNVYRKDIETIFPIAGNEMDQLAENILILSNLERCRDLLREIIKEKCIHLPTDNDRINLRTDDSSQKYKFKDYRKKYNPNDIVYSLYSIITENDVEEFLNKFKFII